MTDINKYVEDISASCLSAASHTVPFTSIRQSGWIPGRSEYVDPFKKKSHFWHNLWVQCSRPRDGVISDIMHKTYAEYHIAVRHVKKNENIIINDRFAAGLIGNQNRTFGLRLNIFGRIKHVLVTVLTRNLLWSILLIFLLINTRSCIHLLHSVLMTWQVSNCR